MERPAVVPGARTRPVRRRLAARLADIDTRVDAARAAATRTHPVPGAYRALARQVGIDPDADGLPLEALLHDRLLRGAFHSTGPVPDACAIALLETGVPVWALEASEVAGPLRLVVVEDGGIGVGDGRRLLAPLLGPPLEEVAAEPTALEVVLFAVVAPGVPRGTVREALWTAAHALEDS